MRLFRPSSSGPPGTRARALFGHIRCDNGPELTANALRDWCRFSKTGSAYIEPGSPWQNPYVESFGSRIRDELLTVEQFSCLEEAKVMVEDWRADYNLHRPHSAFAMMAPARFAKAWREAVAEDKALATASEARRSPRNAPIPATIANEPDRAAGADQTAPAATLRSPLRGFAPRGGGTTLHSNTYHPLSQQVDR
jgi:hypothetical protein